MKYKHLFLSLFILFSVLGSWAFWLEPASFVITKTELKLPQWSTECSPLKVVLLSDLHVGSPYNGLDNLAKIVAKTNETEPDLILLAGDFVIHEVMGGSFVRPEPIAQELKKLTAKLGVYAVLGNHDWWYSQRKVTAALQQVGIPVLENTAVHLHDNQCNFWLAGIGDFWMGQHRPERALEGIPEKVPVLAFTHNPDIFYELPLRIALTFAGHTHGGQVNLPLVGRLIVPSRYGEKFAMGHIREGGGNMFVSTGIGTSILPVRFRVPPEIAVVSLRAF